MSALINRILAATWYPDICKNHQDYIVLAKTLHPDLNNNAECIAAFTHLNKLKDDFEKGYAFSDESGEYRSNFMTHRWTGDKSFLDASKLNYDKLRHTAMKKFDADSLAHFMQYIPSNLEFESNTLTYQSKRKCIPLSRVITLLPAVNRNKHVNWIFSRMIEFVTMLEALGITHAGINPDSIFIIPETHAIKVVTFYHVCTDKVKTINGKYRTYYPPQLFDTKVAGAYIDILLAKKTAICALGDPSGSGVKLRSEADVNTNVLNYLLTPETEAFRSMRLWREVLGTNFVKEFIKLEV